MRQCENTSEILSVEMPNVVITRVQRSGPPRRSRNLEERIAMRFPFVLRRLARVISRLSPRSRVRRVILRRGFRSGWASFERRDFELYLLLVTPDAEFEFPSSMQTLGLAGSFRGHEGRTEALSKIFEVWGSELEPAYMLDLGDRVLNLGFWHTQARASGVQLDQEFAQLSTMRDGLVFRDQIFFSWKEGLRAAGLEPDAVAVPVHGKTSQGGSSAR
jgi:ketosteroid isomerase-like protein